MKKSEKNSNKKHKSTTNSCNFEYGLLPPTKNSDQVYDLMRLGYLYKVELWKIGREHRVQYRAIVRSDELDVLDAKSDVLRAELKIAKSSIKKIKAKTRKRSTPEMVPFQAKVKEISPQLKVLREQHKAIRDAVKKDPEIVKAVEALNESLTKEIKKIRAASGLSGSWGTYLVAERAAADARYEPAGPTFPFWTGSGFIAVQLQGGLDPADTAYDKRFQIDPVDADAYDAPKRGDRRRKARTVVRLRIGSDENRKPIWADFPAIIHRPLPVDSKIKEVRVIKRHVGAKFRWTLLVTIARPKTAPPMHRGHSGQGRIGIDIGWRLHPDGSLRVACWRDDQGQSGEYVLDPSYCKAHDKVESLRSRRDKNVDAMRPVLVDLIKEIDVGRQSPAEGPLPAWFMNRIYREKTETRKGTNIALWKSPARFAALALTWRNQRFDGDDHAYDLINTWRHQDKHLLDWESSLREKILGRRRDGYRCFAAKIADRYEMVVMENFDLRKVARLKKPDGEETPLHAAARYQRQVAAVSTLRQAIKNACAMRGAGYLEVPAAYTTKICHACGSVEKWDQGRDLVHTCSDCGLRWDQDDNAADNILHARGVVLPGGRSEEIQPSA